MFAQRFRCSVVAFIMSNLLWHLPNCSMHSSEFVPYVNEVQQDYISILSPLFNGLGVLYSASDKAKLLAKNFSKNSDLDNSGISLPTIPSRTNLKLYNISVAHRMVKSS